MAPTSGQESQDGSMSDSAGSGCARRHHYLPGQTYCTFERL
nr:hypothetical protein JVH1_4350 [Rhodococcus sp. JVH1]